MNKETLIKMHNDEVEEIRADKRADIALISFLSICVVYFGYHIIKYLL